MSPQIEAQNLSELQGRLWNIADTLRGKMNADEFRDYCLGFIFYKYLSEKFVAYANKILAEDGIQYNELTAEHPAYQDIVDAVKEDSIQTLGYFLPPTDLFHTMAERVAKDPKGTGTGFILEDLATTLRSIEQSTLGTDSADDFSNLFEDLDLGSSKLGNTAKAKNELIGKVVTELDKLSFNLSEASSDILGDAYEYLIGQFASGAGKKAGEFYTPQPVSTLLAKIVTTHKLKLKNVYDPTCGSGSLLLRVKREASSVGKIYGQEMNRTTYNLARMNMILHGVHYADFEIIQEDTLEHPQHTHLKFDAIVANPPFSAKWSASPLFMNDDRFAQYGKLAPSSKADMAFLQHMFHHLEDDGTMAVVLPHGVLFRGAAEGHIRQFMIEKLNCIDAVIGLPANIFYGTSIPTCVLVLRKCRKHNDSILFIDASNDFEKVKTQNRLLPEHIDKIADTYNDWKALEKYSHIATLEEIRNNDYNLNIPRYVDTYEAEEEIDLNAVAQEIRDLEGKVAEIDKTIAGFCKELGIEAPYGMMEGGK
ncbi:TPA: type I restriction-modification system subunit M [Escherichia coli]|nr:type I restriction-modification system subunit M [Escherichia coli]HDW7521705.1 type I restriction-modification system subunit M [Escherichia coli]